MVLVHNKRDQPSLMMKIPGQAYSRMISAAESMLTELIRQYDERSRRKMLWAAVVFLKGLFGSSIKRTGPVDNARYVGDDF